MNILDYATVALKDDDDSIEIIDQTLLPGKVELIRLRTAQEMWDAIYRLQVRGAPAIGVTAAFAIYLLMKHSGAETAGQYLEEFHDKASYLCSSRPTAVNLSWALRRMEEKARLVLCETQAENGQKESCLSDGLRHLLMQGLHDEAVAIQEEDIDICRRIGEHGLSLIRPGWGLLTHCNAGQLATSRYGTATAPMYLAHEKGYGIHVYCDETRPLLQGARLTSFELSSAGIDTTLLCDNMASSLMKEGRIQAVFVGCDRVAANGDAANKIGTSGVAILARHYGIPFYVCAPGSTIDPDTPTGADIVIEQRKPSEVTDLWYSEHMAPQGISVYNPAFDVTDHELITAIITENGVLTPPYRFNNNS